MRWLTQLSCFVVLVNSRGAEVREHEPATLSCSDIPNGELLSLSWTKRGPEGGTTIFQHIANQEEGGIRVNNSFTERIHDIPYSEHFLA